MLRSASLSAPIYDAQFRSILESKVIAMDETPIRAGRVGPGKMRTAWFRPVFGDRDEIAFPFRLSRENGAVPDLLGDFEGTLLSDGNQAYAAYAESRNGAVRHAGCLSHARREFERAKDSEPGLAAEALEPVGGLFLCERKIRKKKPEGREKLEFRRSRALPVAEAFWKWCGRHYEDPRHLPKSPIAEAPDYVLNREGAAGGLAFRPRRPDRHQPSGARPAGPAARQEELALLLDGGRSGSRRDRPEPGRRAPAPGRRPASLPGRRARRISVHPSSRVEEPAPRLWKDLFAANPMTSDLGTGVPCRASDLPGRKLNPAKSDKIHTSQFARLRPAGGAVGRAAKARFLDEGLDHGRAAAADPLPVPRQLAGRHAEGAGGEVLGLGPGEDREPGVVREEVPVAAALAVARPIQASRAGRVLVEDSSSRHPRRRPRRSARK